MAEKGKLAILFCLSIIASVGIYSYFSVYQAETKAPVTLPIQAQKTPLLNDPPLELNSELVRKEEQSRQIIKYDFVVLQTTPINKLKAEIEHFWQRCRQQFTCDDWLNDLQLIASDERYQLVSEYPEKLSQMQQELSATLNRHSNTINDKIEQLKAAHYSVWGEISNELFADEYGYYTNFSQLEQLNNKQWFSTDAKLAGFEQWLQQQHSDKTSGLDSYRWARSFFEEEINADSSTRLESLLADKYLNKDQALLEHNRLHKRQQQHVQAGKYQQELKVLRETLDAQRKSESNELSESEWLQHEAKQLRDFRKSFFQNN